MVYSYSVSVWVLMWDAHNTDVNADVNANVILLWLPMLSSLQILQPGNSST